MTRTSRPATTTAIDEPSPVRDPRQMTSQLEDAGSHLGIFEMHVSRLLAEALGYLRGRLLTPTC